MIRSNCEFVRTKIFTALLFLALFFIGLGYIAIMPVFEGFDETAHYSRLREVAISPSAIFNRDSFLDAMVVDYSGPTPYKSGLPSYFHDNSYNAFFSKKNIYTAYENKYKNSPTSIFFNPSSQVNWQIQHPPLYYLLLSPIVNNGSHFSLVDQFFIIRVISFVVSLTGIFFGYIAIAKMENYWTSQEISSFRLGFFIYPLLFPMFFLEFARIGNDSLCIFFVGLFFYSFLAWMDSKYKFRWALMMGCSLALGLVTKALFMPITAAAFLLLMIYLFLKKDSSFRLNDYLSALFVFLLPLLIGGGWYIFKYIYLGDPGLGSESLKLSHQGGLLKGLLEHFNLLAFLRGIFVPLVSFFWAGTWSLVRLPLVMYLPLFVFASLILIGYFLFIKKGGDLCLKIMPLLMFSSIYFGLIWHVLITMALGRVATSPGWYLHILMPILAPFIGVSFVLVSTRLNKYFFWALVFYPILFQLIAISCHMALYSGFAVKGEAKQFIFSDTISIYKILEHLKIISYPYVGITSFCIGFCLLVYLVLKVFSNYRKSSII